MHLKHPSRTPIVYHTLRPKHEKQERGEKKNITRRDSKNSLFKQTKQKESHLNCKIS